jgi:CheY-like chemotaxis protein
MPQEYPRILCVDDQEDFLVLLDHFLKANEFSVVATAKCKEALEFALQERFAAAVLDFSMPEMNGEELAIRLRAINPEMPIVLFSASSHDLPESVFSVVDLTVSKSFPISNLVTVLKRLTSPVRPERRSAARHRVNLQIRALGDDVESGVMKAADVSISGIGVSGNLLLPVGSELEIAILNDSDELLLTTGAEVRYAVPGRTGLAFRNVSERQRATISALCSGQ